MLPRSMRKNRGAMGNVLILIALALFVALALPGPARAEVIDVPCELSATLALGQAIEQANANLGPDTIRLEEGCTYGLFGTYVYDEGHNGLPVITDALTIEGNGARLERMGSQKFRLLKATADLTIEDLTLANGHADDPNSVARGGTIFNEGDLTLQNVKVIENVAPGRGAGVFSTGGNLTVRSSRFEDNHSQLGTGGGLYAELGDVLLHTTQFVGNVAKTFGGGATLASAPAEVVETEFIGNSLTSLESGGAGLTVLHADAIVEKSLFLDNVATYGQGGGLYVRNVEHVTVSDSHFEKNKALQSGGIHVIKARMTLLRSTFHENESDSYATTLSLSMRAGTFSLIANNLWTANGVSDADGQTTAHVTAPVAGETTLVRIAHNTFADPRGIATNAILIHSGAAQVVNNIIANYSYGLSSTSETVSAGYNLYDLPNLDKAQRGDISPFGDGTVLLGDPLFVNSGAGNYRLQGGSPAIDQGYSLGLDYDIDGADRPQGDGYDIGAYEHTPQNKAPVATNDSYATQQNRALTVAAPGVLANDEDADGDALTAALDGQPEHGTVALNVNGSFTYTPDNGYYGEDSFRYRAHDGEAQSNKATVTIAVQKVNSAPTAKNDSYVTLQNTALVIAAPGVLDNDEDVDGDGLTAVLRSQPEHGAVALNADGSFIYTPDNGYYGEESFAYRAFDGEDSSAEATVRITVKRVNVAPSAQNDAYGALQDTALIVSAPGVLDNDEDADGDGLTAELVTLPDFGSLTLEADGSFIYTPDSGYVGPDGFTYRAHDGVDGSDVATVTITVEATGTNLPPVAVGDSYETETNTPLAVAAPGVLGNDADANGDALTALLATGPAYGELTLNADGSFTYTPDEDFAGEDSFTYQAGDGVSLSNVVTVRIWVVGEQAPQEPLTESMFLPVFVR